MLTRTNFTNCMNRLLAFFGKRLTDQQLDIYYTKLRFVADEAFEEICDELIENTKPNPSYLPSIQSFREAWVEWLDRHPDKYAREYEETWCPECGGRGYFEVEYRSRRVKGFSESQTAPARDSGGEAWYDTIVPCGRCENWKRTFPTQGKLRPRKRWTREEIEKAEGLRFKNNHPGRELR